MKLRKGQRYMIYQDWVMPHKWINVEILCARGNTVRFAPVITMSNGSEYVLRHLPIDAPKQVFLNDLQRH